MRSDFVELGLFDCVSNIFSDRFWDVPLSPDSLSGIAVVVPLVLQGVLARILNLRRLPCVLGVCAQPK